MTNAVPYCCSTESNGCPFGTTIDSFLMLLKFLEHEESNFCVDIESKLSR